jgi:hypothetical protein
MDTYTQSNRNVMNDSGEPSMEIVFNDDEAIKKLQNKVAFQSLHPNKKMVNKQKLFTPGKEVSRYSVDNMLHASNNDFAGKV